MGSANAVACLCLLLGIAVSVDADARGKGKARSRAHGRTARAGQTAPRVERPTRWATGPLPMALASVRKHARGDGFADGMLSEDWFRAGSQWKELDAWGRPVAMHTLEDKPSRGKDGWWSPNRFKKIRGSAGAGVFVRDDRVWSGPGIPWTPSRSERAGWAQLGLQASRTTFFRVSEAKASGLPVGCSATGGSRLVVACLRKDAGWAIDYEESIDPSFADVIRKRMKFSVRSVLDMDQDGKMEVVVVQGVADGKILSWRGSKYQVVAHGVDDMP